MKEQDRYWNTILTFKGSGKIFPSSICSSLGEIWTYQGKEYVFNGKDWELLGSIPNPIPVYRKADIINCPNCGAPQVGHKCEYCGTKLKEVIKF